MLFHHDKDHFIIQIQFLCIGMAMDISLTVVLFLLLFLQF